MELRPEVRRSQSELSLGRSLPIVHEQLWLRLPIVMLVVGALAVTASLWVPSPQTVRGSAVVRLPGLTHVRVDSKGTLGAVYVAEGEPLEAGQPLAMMSVPQIDADLRSARLALADAMATMLRAPRDNATGNLVREGRLRVRDLQRRKEALVIRAPSSGHLLAVRVTSGAAVEQGDIVFVLAHETGTPEITATFAGPMAARIEPGSTIRLDLGEVSRAPVLFSVSSVAQEAVRPDTPYRRPELAAKSDDASVVVVRAEMVDPTVAHQLFDGMMVPAEVIVRSRTLAHRLGDSLGLTEAR